jgi:hypothetical protein
VDDGLDEVVLNLAGIQKAILTELERLEGLVDEIRLAGHTAAEAEVAYKTANAVARLQAKALGKVTEASAQDSADVQCEELRLQHLLKANNLTVIREALRASQARLDGLRTLASGFKIAGG